MTPIAASVAQGEPHPESPAWRGWTLCSHVRASAGAPGSSESEILVRLRQLEELNREGLLSDEAYARKRAELLFPEGHPARGE